MKTMLDVGEKAFLRALLPTLSVAPSFTNGFGHDASIIDIGLEKDLAFKIDRAPYPVALRHQVGDFRTWGRLAVAANVSDVLAVGAIPHALMLSLVLPGDFLEDDARAIVKGCEEACEEHEVAFIGGDTKQGAAAQVVGAALGTVEKGASFGRAFALPGDHLFIAGRLGGFAGATALIEQAPAGLGSQADWHHVLTRPSARVKEGRYMRESRRVAAACDLSDGLSDALNMFCSNGAGITLTEERLPMHRLAGVAARARTAPAWRFAFGVGDWSIACVVREADAAKFQADCGSDLELFDVGQFNDSGQKLICDQDGKSHQVPNLINEQFRKRIEDGSDYLTALLRG